MGPRAALGILLLASGCTSDDGGFAEAPDRPDPEPSLAVCGQPVTGFDRLVQADRGTDLDYAGDPSPGSCPWIPGGVVAEDLDADGDVDLLFADPRGFPALYANDGGQLAAVDVPVELPFEGRFALGLVAVDLDGDGLPEVAVSGARVHVQTDERLHVQEIHGPRVLGQSPAIAHVGLGSQQVLQVEVLWPDGAVSSVVPEPDTRLLVVEHPSL